MSNLDKITCALLDLHGALREEGYNLEHIKLDSNLVDGGKTVSTIHGIEIKSVIYEDDATHWR